MRPLEQMRVSAHPDFRRLFTDADIENYERGVPYLMSLVRLAEAGAIGSTIARVAIWPNFGRR